ncbi:unnamed protein product [Adineta steineri]|uniref:Uncharacterized protein n=3 Tax=Adineta steineri TaxID=433720 RepID=A0A814SPV9_9BILA|nr:unnamed protein product [Adineta steineri]
MVIELNLFKSIPPSQDEVILRKERHQTRLYLILLVIGIVTLTIFTSARDQSIIVTVESPSLTNFIDLYEQYPTTLTCPCSQITLQYNEFISDIKAQYYEICLSEFITSRWINLQFIQNPARVFFTNDIRYQSQIHFQLLSTLCSIANQTIEDNLESFYQTTFVTNQVLSLSSFQTQVNLIVEQFKTNLPESYQRTLQLIQMNSEINQFIVPANSKFEYITDEYGAELYQLKSAVNLYSYRIICNLNTDCSCVSSSNGDCILQTMIAKTAKTFNIPGMFQTWFPLQSVLISTLECFYNDTYFAEIIRLIDRRISSNNFSTLQLSLLSSNDSQYDQINVLANKLFVQSWNNESSYQSYFNQCHPLTCQYSYQSRFNIIYVITTIVGLLGGLSIVLRLIIPPVIISTSQIRNYMMYCCRRRQTDIVSNVEAKPVKQGFHNRLRFLIIFVKEYIVKLNLFTTIPPSEDENILRRSRQMTRIYIILVIISILILAAYTALTQETATVTVKSPTLSTYKELFNDHSSTLECSCSQIAVEYNRFISQFEPEYHIICSSTFTSSEWLDSFYNLAKNGNIELDNDDFRVYARAQFQAVSEMCSLSKNILNLSSSIWLQTDFVTANIMTRVEFTTQIEALIEEFKRNTFSEFIQTFQLIQVTNNANQLATKYSSNWQFIVRSDYYSSIRDDSLILLGAKIAQISLNTISLPVTYEDDSCSCIQNSSCSILPGFAFRLSNQSLRQTLPGFRIGCLILDSLLQSTFSCLYNQTCLNFLLTTNYYAKPFPANIISDSSSSSSQNTIIETYLEQLFTTKWDPQVSYDSYFSECAPKSCQYTYLIKFNQVYFLTTMIALLGGLTKGLHFLVALVAMIVFKIYDNRKKNQVVPSSQQSNIIIDESNDQNIEVVPVPQMSTIEITDDPNEEEIKTLKTNTNWTIRICVSLLIITAIVVASVIWFENKNIDNISTTMSTVVTETTSITTIELTTTSTDHCYMTFESQSRTYSIGLGGRAFAVGDLNKDSILDLVVTNYDDSTISVLLGNPNGTFMMQQIYSTGNESYPRGTTIGDFNNDTFQDLAVTISIPNQIAIFFGITPDGAFNTVPHIYNTDQYYNSTYNAIEAADFNGDGYTDLVISGFCQCYPNSSILFRAINSGDGYNYITISITGLPIIHDDSIAIGDFDNDGQKNDISVSTIGSLVYTVSKNYYFDGPITYENSSAPNQVYESPQSIISGKFNDDEFDDLALVSSQSDTLQILLAYGDGTFTQQIYLTDSYPTSVSRINFNNDSIDDLVVLSGNQTLSIYLGTNIGIFNRHTVSYYIGQTTTDQCIPPLKVADLNQDGKDDLICIDQRASSIRVLLGTICNEHI